MQHHICGAQELVDTSILSRYFPIKHPKPLHSKTHVSYIYIFLNASYCGFTFALCGRNRRSTRRSRIFILYFRPMLGVSYFPSLMEDLQDEPRYLDNTLKYTRSIASKSPVSSSQIKEITAKRLRAVNAR